MTRRTLSLGLGVACALLIGAKTVDAATSSAAVLEACSEEISACMFESTDCSSCLAEVQDLLSDSGAIPVTSDATCTEKISALCDWVEGSTTCNTADSYVLDLAACISINALGCPDFTTCDLAPLTTPPTMAPAVAPVPATSTPVAATSAPRAGVDTTTVPTPGSRALDPTLSPTSTPTSAPTSAPTSEASSLSPLPTLPATPSPDVDDDGTPGSGAAGDTDGAASLSLGSTAWGVVAGLSLAQVVAAFAS